jgi:hypothetical protein
MTNDEQARAKRVHTFISIPSRTREKKKPVGPAVL